MIRPTETVVYHSLRVLRERKVDDELLARACKAALVDEDDEKLIAFIRLCALEKIGLPYSFTVDDANETRKYRRPPQKLTEEKVLAIRAEAAVGARQCDLVRKYKISGMQVNRVVNGTSWKWLKERVFE